MKKAAVLLLTFLHIQALASSKLSLKSLGGFAAPAIDDYTNLPYPEKGAIILDTDNNLFRGNLGTPAAPIWVTLSTTNSNVSNPESVPMSIASASITTTSTPGCNVNRADGGWITSCTRNPSIAGETSITFAIPFDSSPVCTLTPLENTSSVTVKLSSVSSTGMLFAVTETTTAAPIDSEVHIICIGQKQ